ncbi:MAG TPA: hypothetical protein VGI19_03110 [Candidatus Cybelea sp.]|jgi:hypothetical protein
MPSPFLAALSRVPILFALPLFVVLFAAVGIAAHALVRKFVTQKTLMEGHDVAGFILAVVGVLYSVVIGFLVGAVWSDFSAAQETSNQEAGFVSDTYNLAGLLEQPQHKELQRLIARYAIHVRDVELSLHGNSGDQTSIHLLADAVRLAATMPPPSESAGLGRILENNTIRTEVLEGLRSIADARRERLVQAQDRLPPGMLEALTLGAAMVVAFAFFFGVDRFAKQMLMTALLAGLIGLFFGLVIELSLPYSGSIQISRDAWDDVIANNHLDRLP